MILYIPGTVFAKDKFKFKSLQHRFPPKQPASTFRVQSSFSTYKSPILFRIIQRPTMLSITGLSTVRMGVGFSFLAVPELAAKMCLLPAIPGATLVSRLVGARDLALGAFTLYAARQAFGKNSSSNNTATTASGGGTAGLGSAGKHTTATGSSTTATSLLNASSTTQEEVDADANRKSHAHVLGSVLAMNIAVDAMDIVACLWCFEQGNLALHPALIFGGGAAMLMDLGIYAMIRRRRAGVLGIK